MSFVMPGSLCIKAWTNNKHNLGSILKLEIIIISRPGCFYKNLTHFPKTGKLHCSPQTKLHRAPGQYFSAEFVFSWDPFNRWLILVQVREERGERVEVKTSVSDFWLMSDLIRCCDRCRRWWWRWWGHELRVCCDIITAGGMKDFQVDIIWSSMIYWPGCLGNHNFPNHAKISVVDLTRVSELNYYIMYERVETCLVKNTCKFFWVKHLLVFIEPLVLYWRIL